MSRPCALVVGVGDRRGIGAAIALHAAAKGLDVFMVCRTAGRLDPLVSEIEASGGRAQALVADCTRPAEMEAVFDTLRGSGQPLRLVVYNTGRNVPAPLLGSDIEMLDDHFRRCTYGGFLVGQASVRLMLETSDDSGCRGTILYTGASASLRGRPLFAGFSAAKAGLRAMAQSMAREFGPKGIHVAHVVVDGVVNGSIVRELGGGLGRWLLKRKGVDGALDPDAIAQAFLMLHEQPRSAWTQELDLRPWKEAF